jgi:hypothetical protein
MRPGNMATDCCPEQPRAPRPDEAALCAAPRSPSFDILRGMRATVPFRLRATDGVIVAELSVNADPVALGCHLLDAELPTNVAQGFPVCEASADIDLKGYAACHGWLQLVRSSDSEDNPGLFEIDPLSLFRGVSTPYAFFGVKPTLFDAPFRASKYDMAWEAHSYLVFTPDAVMTRRVRAAAGFSWGFTVAHGVVTISDPAPLDASTWDSHLPELSRQFPDWAFETGYHE